jgi:DNA-binding CsgD family transcriptional regulator
MTFECFESADNILSTLGQTTSNLESAATDWGLVAVLWSGLKIGLFRIDWTVTEPSQVAMALKVGDRSPLSSMPMSRGSSMLERVLLGGSQKCAGFEGGVAPSTIALALKVSAARMGLCGRFMRVPLCVPLLAHAARRPGLVSFSLEGGLPRGPGDECVVRLERTEGVLAQELTESEFAVAGALLEGKSYVEIAARRDVSIRTVANQMAAVGKKLGTRGRFDLLRASIERSTPAKPGPATSPLLSGSTQVSQAPLRIYA